MSLTNFLINLIDTKPDEALRLLSEEFRLPTTNSDFWWVNYPVRALNECRKMIDNSYSIVYSSGTNLIWEVAIRSNLGSDFQFSIESNHEFPYIMPKVYIKEPYIDCDVHMLSEGQLCLMHESDYRSSMSILDFRNMACSWVFCYEIYSQTREWPGAEFKH